MPQHRFHFSCYLLGNPACHLKLHSFTYAMQKSVSGYRILLVLLFVFETITIVYESRRPSRRVARLHDALITLCMFSGAAICLLTVTSLVTGPGTAWHRWGLVRQASRAGWQVMWNVLYPQLGYSPYSWC